MGATEPTAAAPTSRLVLAVGRFLGKNRRRLLELLLGVFLPLCLFALLTREVVHRQPPPWDVAVLRWLHGHASPTLDRWMISASRVGTTDGLVPISIGIALWLLVRRQVARLSFFLLSMLGTWFLSDVTKQLFGRERPALWPSPAPEQSFSFPSGHAMGSMALAASVGVLAWRTPLRWPAVVAAAAFTVVVSSSRMYLGVHYPTDVLGAWLASLTWVLGLRHVLLARAHR